IIDVGENAQVKFAEYFESKNAATFLYNDLQEIFVNASARVEWYRLENENCPGIHVQSQKVKQEKNSYFKSWSFIKDVQKLRNNTYVQLTGPFAETNIYGLSFQNGKSHADNHILVDHAVEDCQSNQLFKGTYNDNSTAVFNGKVLVRKDAQRTNAFQSNKNLLLSEKATINSKPELEIYADDVKCSHGATTGQMNEDQLFYLQARGIEKEKAKAILNQAFLSEVLDYISIPELKNHLKDYFNQCFETA
ncbi:MAG: Fe-S cluster assembly protein SufD, partial [Chitinophagales bacterium]